jgi:hypothetical protein
MLSLRTLSSKSFVSGIEARSRAIRDDALLETEE